VQGLIRPTPYTYIHITLIVYYGVICKIAKKKKNVSVDIPKDWKGIAHGRNSCEIIALKFFEQLMRIFVTFSTGVKLQIYCDMTPEGRNSGAR
jgi:hypothetical protein